MIKKIINKNKYILSFLILLLIPISTIFIKSAKAVDYPLGTPTLRVIHSSPESVNVMIIRGFVSSAEEYILERSFNGGSWNIIYTFTLTEQYIDRNLNVGTYQYRLKAVDTHQIFSDSKYSSIQTVSVLSINDIEDYQLNTPTFDLTHPFPESVNVMIVRGSTTGADQYILQRSFNGGTWLTIHTFTTLIEYVDFNLNVGTYQYRLKAVDTNQGYLDSEFSTIKTVSILINPDSDLNLDDTDMGFDMNNLYIIIGIIILIPISILIYKKMKK